MPGSLPGTFQASVFLFRHFLHSVFMFHLFASLTLLVRAARGSHAWHSDWQGGGRPVVWWARTGVQSISVYRT